MRVLLILLSVWTLCVADSFITQEEYANQLYHNPRGIGCNLCHGENGEGKHIAYYKHKGEDRSFHPPAINDLDYEYFAKSLKYRIQGMPRYFLTTDEIKALYFYLHQEVIE